MILKTDKEQLTALGYNWAYDHEGARYAVTVELFRQGMPTGLKFRASTQV